MHFRAIIREPGEKIGELKLKSAFYSHFFGRTGKIEKSKNYGRFRAMLRGLGTMFKKRKLNCAF